jgi:hypothetical protein
MNRYAKRKELTLHIPNAGAHLLPEAEARNERRLEAVRCSAWLGAARTGMEPRLAFLCSPAFGQAREFFEPDPVS